jgi:hypothetical protein
MALVCIAVFSCGSPSTNAPSEDAGTADAAPEQATWKAVAEHLDGSLLGIWGSSERDIWAVGGPLGNAGLETLVMHYDGQAWRRVAAGGTETFWWVHGTSSTDVWAVGEKGRMAHWNGIQWRSLPALTTATLFGVWAASPTDAWAVGGVPNGEQGPKDVLLHWDGASWKVESLPEATDVALFKVWGSSREDMYVVGEGGVVWHRTKGAFQREAKGVAKGRLTTVAGCLPNTGEAPFKVFAVGGRELLTSDEKSTWTRSQDVFVNDLNGVACAAATAPMRDAFGAAVIVGGGSLKLRLVQGVWISDFGTEPFQDLHGAWVDPTGSFWAVGGNFNAAAHAGQSRDGVIARFGM